MKFFENWKTLFRLEIPERTKKIIITVSVVVLVFLFFLWLELGLLSTASEEKQQVLRSLSLMYAVFPLLTFLFSGIRIYRILTGEEPVNESPDEGQEETETK